MKLCVPLTGNRKCLEIILNQFENTIYEVYAGVAQNIIGNARMRTYEIDGKELKNQVRMAHDYDVTYNVIINASCLGGLHSNPEFQDKINTFFDYLSEIEVDAVTVTEPFLLEIMKNRHPEICAIVSSLAMIDDPVKAKHFEQLGADRIVLSLDINRNIEKIQEIKNAVNCQLELVVNENCLYKCPFKSSHINAASHSTTTDWLKKNYHFLRSYHNFRCISMRLQDPSQLLKSPWIRPEDTQFYEEVSNINFFKIAGRNVSVPFIKRAVKAYLDRKYEGNLLDLMNTTYYVIDSLYIDNSKLENFVQRVLKCDKNCTTCTYCDEQASNLIRLKEVKHHETMPIAIGSTD